MSIGGRTELDPVARIEARTAVRREWRLQVATRGGWPQLDGDRIRIERFGIVIDERDDSRYRIHRGEVDVAHPAIAAYFITDYGARVPRADAAMTVYSTVIKLAPVLTAERWGDPEWTRPGRTFYWPGSLKLIPRQPTPLVVNHDMQRRVGVVDRLFQIDWNDGPWICASCTVTDPPDWLKRYDTKASFGSWDVHSTTHDDGWERVTSTILQEVCASDRPPAQRASRATWCRIREKAPEAEQVFYGGQTLRRTFETPIVVR